MTKTLTEQWREGTLPDGYYYIDYDTQQKIFEIEDGCATYQGLPAETYFLNDVCLIKVLAPVPSYDHFSQLVKKVERLQEQLKEANEVIKKYRVVEMGLRNNKGTLESVCPAFDYLKKWGVK